MKRPAEFPPRTPEQIEAAEAQIVEQSKRIEFYLTEYSVELLATKMSKGDFVVPAYQRAYTWEETRKSRFIESLIIGLPIPFLFFWEMPDGKLEIVDGSQRLRAIEEFIFSGMRLGELDSLTWLSEFTFAELPQSRQRKILNRSIRGIVLNEHADEQARFDMFDRINTGSKIANNAEVRRGALAGPFMTLIREMSESEIFKQLAPVSRKAENEREREELVARFFAYGDGLEGYRDRPSEFLFNYVKAMNNRIKDDAELLERYKTNFEEVMSFISQVFPFGFRKNQKGTATRRARFEAIAVGSRLALRDDPDLVPARVPNVQDWLDSEDFVRITGSDGANAKSRLEERMNFVKQKLLDR